jgi:hypothetical protein
MKTARFEVKTVEFDIKTVNFELNWRNLRFADEKMAEKGRIWVKNGVILYKNR